MPADVLRNHITFGGRTADSKDETSMSTTIDVTAAAAAKASAHIDPVCAEQLVVDRRLVGEIEVSKRGPGQRRRNLVNDGQHRRAAARLRHRCTRRFDGGARNAESRPLAVQAA